MFLFVNIFCQPYRKRAIENKPALGALEDRDIENLKLFHLVNKNVNCNFFSIMMNNKFYGIF